MSRSLAIVASGLLLIAGFVSLVEGQTSSVQCLSEWAWSYNSKQQSPCLVAAYLDGACNGGDYNIDPLPVGHHYVGPTSDVANPCQCSTVSYSLISACGACQNRTIVSWSSWAANCSTVYNSQFSEDVPSGTAVPHWAYNDVVTSDSFNPVTAETTGDGPETTGSAQQSTASVGPVSTGAGSADTGPTPTPTSGSSNSGTSSSSKSNAGAIAGGVIGGLVGLGLIGGLIAYFLVRRRRQSHKAPSAAFTSNVLDGNTKGAMSPPPMSFSPYSDGASARPFSPEGLQPMQHSQPRLYNPSDPSTFPMAAPSPTLHTTNSDYATSIGFNPHAAPGVPRGQYSGAPEI